jgi:2-polyprenyl-3-methyl-5-hydroxy-6-metoxy-1,4-benzoquinol methylase
MPAATEAALEDLPCPMGCSCGDDTILTDRDRTYNQPGQFTVVRCRQCRLMRTNPRPTAEGILHYYPNEYAAYRDVPSSAELPVPSAALWKRAIRRLLKVPDSRVLPPLPPGSLLEIGCASGQFLRMMAARGWQVQGWELSERAASLARSQGFDVHIGNLESAEEPAASYDLIVGWHVFEHLHQPAAVLRKLRQWSRPGGWLALSMPDASSWEFSFFRERWYGLQLPNHLFHYTPCTLNQLLARSGWRADRYFWHANAGNLLQSLRYCSADRGWNRIADLLSDVAQGRRFHYPNRLLAKLLGWMRASGRMTVWAQRDG